MTISDARITFDAYTDYFIKLKAQSDIAPSTANNYRFTKKKIAPYIGHIQLKNLTPTALYAEDKCCLFASVARHRVALLGKLQQHRVVVCTRSFSAFCLRQTERRLRGCRIGELCALTWSNIDFDEGRIHICRHFVQSCHGWHITDGCKTVAGERWLYMDENIMDMLREYRAYYFKAAKEYGTKWDVFANAVFFTTGQNAGYFISPNFMRMWFRSFLKKNKLSDYHPHQFRHTAISLQLQAGVSVPDVAKRAGHSRSDVTLSVYAHVIKNNDKHCKELPFSKFR